MPRLNDDGTLLTVGVGVTWFDHNRWIQYNVPDGNLNIELSDGTHIAGPVAISSVYAANGHWCAEVNGQGVLVDGKLIPGAALASYCDPIGPDGSCVVKRLRDSYGPWGFVGGADFGGDCRTVTNYGSGRASWIEGDWVFHTNFGSPFDGTRCYNYRLKGSDFLYQSADGGMLVLNGRVIAPGGDYFRPDFKLVDGVYYVYYGPTEADIPAEPIVIKDLAAYPLVGSKPAGKKDPPPPPKGPIVSYTPAKDYVTSQLSDNQLRDLIDGALQEANSNDDPVYWFDHVREKPTPAGQNDWGYWYDRIRTGDGVGKGYKGAGPTTPPPTTPGLTLDQVMVAVAAAINSAVQQISSEIDAKIAEVKAQVAANKPDLSQYAKYGDAVEVGGKVSFFGTNHWGGVISVPNRNEVK